MNVKTWIKDKIYEQHVDHDNVQPRSDYKDNIFYLSSCAGLIKFKPKNMTEIITFRDKWVNQFEAVMLFHQKGVDSRENFYRLYSQILNSNYKVKYKANVKTRLRLLKWKLKNFI